jgi:hypothetical protein
LVEWVAWLLVLFAVGLLGCLADGLTAWLVDLVECFARLRDWSTIELLGCLVIVG